MSLDKTILVEFLTELDRELEGRVTVVAVGGTAMTLLDLKPSTIDVDLTVPAKHYDTFMRALNRAPHGFKVDHWSDGMVFNVVLPDDYLSKSVPIQRIKKIELRALHPLDIVVTKVARLDKTDIEDIKTCVKEYRLTRDQILDRAKQVEYIGSEANYEANLQYIIRLLSEGSSDRTQNAMF